MKEISPKVLSLLEQKYQILAHWKLVDFDHDFSVLRQFAERIMKDRFDPHDRIIIEHMDTDFYIKHDGFHVGVNLRNFFGIMAELDIPHYLFVFYTNHFGIQQEIDLLCESRCLHDRPTIIQTFLSRLHHEPEKIQPLPCDLDSINFNLLCMMHLVRSHRNAAYRALSELDQSKILLSGTNANF